MYIVDLMPIYVIETFLTQGYRKSRSQKISPLQVPRPWTESLAINRGLWQERVKGKRTDYKQQKNQASNKDFMASFFQADAGERGLPALTSEIEEGSNLFSPPPMPFQVGFLPGIFQLTWSLQRTRTDRIPPNKDWKIFVLAIAAVSFSSSSLQRKFLTDKICVEWFECIGANYSGNGEILSRNASPQNIHTAQGSKRFVFGFLPIWVKIQNRLVNKCLNMSTARLLACLTLL